MCTISRGNRIVDTENWIQNTAYNDDLAEPIATLAIFMARFYKHLPTLTWSLHSSDTNAYLHFKLNATEMLDRCLLSTSLSFSCLFFYYFISHLLSKLQGRQRMYIYISHRYYNTNICSMLPLYEYKHVDM